MEVFIEMLDFIIFVSNGGFIVGVVFKGLGDYKFIFLWILFFVEFGKKEGDFKSYL